MKAISKKVAVLAAGALLWCCNGEDTLLDLYPTEPIVNPGVGVLIDGNRIVHASFDGRQQISGVTETGIFSTSDKFRTLDFEPHPWQPAEGAVAFGEDIIVHIQATSTSHILRYSTNKGKTWETYDKPFGGDAIAAGGPLSAVALQVVADRTVWVLCQQESGGDARALLYRVELEPQRSVVVMEKAGVTAMAFGFADLERGWVLYGDPGGGAGSIHVLRTGDGGRKWTEGAVLGGVVHPSVVPVGAEGLLIYDRGGVAFHSTDGGVSFAQVEIGGSVMACQAVSANVVYALLESGVAKSVDGGRTWTTLDAFAHGVDVSGVALDFHDERSGIVYGADCLFLTDNGGQRWDVLVYPYDYVFEEGH